MPGLSGLRGLSGLSGIAGKKAAPSAPHYGVNCASGTAAIKTAASALLDGLSLLTIEGWIKIPALNSGLNRSVLAHEPGTDNGFDLWLTDTDGLALYVGNHAGSEAYATATSGLAAGVWTHFAAVCDGTYAAVFMAGVLGQRTVLASPLGTTTSAMTLGSSISAWPHDALSGSIAHVRISNSVRYPTGNSTYTVPTAPFVVDGNTLDLWAMTEGTGTTCADTGTNNLVATLGGSPAPTWVAGPF
jgi:hypothetical protein